MVKYPDRLRKLIELLQELPGIGARSAERMALHVVQAHETYAKELSECLLQARMSIGFCEICGAFTESQPCDICNDSSRQQNVVCVVEKPTDVLTIEKANIFKGKYHVLNGVLSPLDGKQPEDIRIPELEERVKKEAINEIIFALGTDTQSEATIDYIVKRLATYGVQFSKLARGLPAKFRLDYADELTIASALENRKPIR